jgi:phosphate transport system protein
MEIRKTFHQRLREVQDDTLIMGSMVEKATHRAMAALKDRDLEMARHVIDDDCKVNNKRFEIEEKCVDLIATQQPMASDLRTIVGILSIIAELERIGDYAVGIATNATMLMNEPPLRLPPALFSMDEKAGDMLRRSLDAFVKRDTEAAVRIAGEDDEIDSLYEEALHELIQDMITDPSTVNRATRLIWVAHRLERDGDRVTNICERVVFIATGEMEELGGTICR